jgi:hypothetical protein
MKKKLTDEQIELEIERLSNSPLVKLARKEERIRFKQRQKYYLLKCYEKKGKALADAGVTMEMLEKIDKELSNGG